MKASPPPKSSPKSPPKSPPARPTPRWGERIEALRASGDLKGALDLARHAFSQSPQSRPIARAYGWAIYSSVRAACAELFSARGGGPEAIEARAAARERMSRLAREYAEAHLPRRELCLSLTLSQLARPNEPPPGLLDLLRWATPEGLRAEDLLPRAPYPALLERLALCAARAALAVGEVRGGQVALAWLRDAQARAAPLTDGPALLGLRPGVLRVAGCLDEAASECVSVLRRSPHEAQVWREWSLVERGRDPVLSFWLGVRAASEAQRAGVALSEVVVWCEGLAFLGREVGLRVEALALALWAVECRARAGAPRCDEVVFLSRVLGGVEGLGAPLGVVLAGLEVRGRGVGGV